MPASPSSESVNWEQVKAVVFDLGNVLIDLDNARYSQGWPYDIGAHNPSFAGWAQDLNLFYRYDTGQLSSERFIEMLCAYLQLSPKQVTHYWNAIILPGINPKRYETLATLQQQYSLYVLSNTNDIHIDWVRQHVAAAGYPDFETRFFKKRFYSQRLGALKPEPAIYEQVEKHVQETPDQLLFIDDLQPNVEAARARGWQAVWLEPGRPVEEVLGPVLRY